MNTSSNTIQRIYLGRSAKPIVECLNALTKHLLEIGDAVFQNLSAQNPSQRDLGMRLSAAIRCGVTGPVREFGGWKYSVAIDWVPYYRVRPLMDDDTIELLQESSSSDISALLKQARSLEGELTRLAQRPETEPRLKI